MTYVIVQRGYIHLPTNRAMWLRQCAWLEIMITHTETCVWGALKRLKEKDHGQEEVAKEPALEHCKQQTENWR